MLPPILLKSPARRRDFQCKRGKLYAGNFRVARHVGHAHKTQTNNANIHVELSPKPCTLFYIHPLIFASAVMHL